MVLNSARCLRQLPVINRSEIAELSQIENDTSTKISGAHPQSS